MIIRLNTASTVPIYVQLRNQIVTGIGRGELKVGEKLPTVRQLALDAGVNTMTVNKTYQILRAEGFIEIDRRNGATVRPMKDTTLQYREKLKEELDLCRSIRRETPLPGRHDIWCPCPGIGGSG